MLDDVEGQRASKKEPQIRFPCPIITLLLLLLLTMCVIIMINTFIS